MFKSIKKSSWLTGFEPAIPMGNLSSKPGALTTRPQPLQLAKENMGKGRSFKS
jgi:hypothetical protein